MISISSLFEAANIYRDNIYKGLKVSIVLKKDQRTGKQTIGYVDKILTSKKIHTRGIKVKLDNGLVGRVQKILDSSN